MTSPEQSRRALELFETLVDLAPEEVRDRLDALGAEHPRLAEAVRGLLAADAAEGLESPWTPAREGLGGPIAGIGPGDRLGPFELVRLLGQGGMGKVWEAKRIEGGFEQRVAIKMLRFLEPGSLAERRFSFEREVLGRLEHPAIARIFDAGRTQAGAPYLVMEYVDGARIDDYCAQHGLSVRDRVRLVVEICRVVAHAHRSLVIHRDLKPANILVTKEREPRLLDFGIAKLVDDGSDRRALTVDGLGPMTPEYASPEQILSRPVTTASDVFSMGVVLYELLTGTTPFGSDAVAALARASSGEEAEITPPSRAPDPADAEAGLSHSTDVDGPRGRRSDLSRQVDRDLDNVVVHALRTDPDRRYPSMEAFGSDLERWLGGFPVQARGDSLAYRSAKFVRRNWLALTAAVLVLLSLTGGLGVATWQAKVAREERVRADDQVQLTKEVNRFLVDLFAAPGGRWWRDMEHKGPETRVIDVIDEAAARLETDLEKAPVQRAALHQTLNDTYLALGMIERAERQVRFALEIRTRELGMVHSSVAESSYYLGSTLRAQYRLKEALEIYERAIDVERQLSEPTANLSYALTEGALCAARLGRHETAARWIDEALAVDTAEVGSAAPQGYLHYVRAQLNAERGELRSAGRGLQEAEKALLAAGGSLGRTGFSTAATVTAWLNGDLDRALELSTPVPEGSWLGWWRAQVLFDAGRVEEALSLLGDLGAWSRRRPELPILMARLKLATDGDPERCLELAEPALATEEGWAQDPTWYLAEARSAVAACLAARGRPGDAERARELLISARQVLDQLFDRSTPLHRRIERTRKDLAPSSSGGESAPPPD